MYAEPSVPRHGGSPWYRRIMVQTEHLKCEDSKRKIMSLRGTKQRGLTVGLFRWHVSRGFPAFGRLQWLSVPSSRAIPKIQHFGDSAPCGVSLSMMFDGFMSRWTTGPGTVSVCASPTPSAIR